MSRMKEIVESIKRTISKILTPVNQEELWIRLKQENNVINTEESLYELLNKALDQGLDPSSKDETGLSLLMRACWTGKETIVDLLIKKGADVHAKTPHNANALWYASVRENCSLNVAKKLRALNIDVNNKDTWHKMSPIMMACAHNKIDWVKWLIEQNVDIDVKNKEGLSLWEMAWNEEIKTLLDLEKAKREAKKELEKLNAVVQLQKKEIEKKQKVVNESTMVERSQEPPRKKTLRL